MYLYVYIYSYIFIYIHTYLYTFFLPVIITMILWQLIRLGTRCMVQIVSTNEPKSAQRNKQGT